MHIGHPIEKNQQSVSSFLSKQTRLKNDWRNSLHTNEGKTAKNEWENDDSDFLRALWSVYKKLGQFFFHNLSLTCLKKEQVNKLSIKTMVLALCAQSLW